MPYERTRTRYKKLPYRPVRRAGGYVPAPRLGQRIYSGLNDRELIAEVAARKDESVRHLDELFVQFKEEAEKRGVQVHLARDAADANRIIAKIAEDNGCKMVVKSKS